MATELEYEAVGALATVTGSSSSSLGSQKLGGKPEGNGTPSEAVLQVLLAVDSRLLKQLRGKFERRGEASRHNGGGDTHALGWLT